MPPARCRNPIGTWVALFFFGYKTLADLKSRSPFAKPSGNRAIHAMAQQAYGSENAVQARFSGDAERRRKIEGGGNGGLLHAEAWTTNTTRTSFSLQAECPRALSRLSRVS